MSEDPTTPDLVELTRRSFAAADRRDWDAFESFFAADAVWEAQEFQAFEGRKSIRAFVEYVLGTYHNPDIVVEEPLNLGGGVVFVIASVEGRLAESTAHMRTRMGAVCQWADSQIARVASYVDIDEARAAAERLAESRE